MEKRQKILEARQRLDKTLASPDLTNEESVKTLVKSQLLRSPFEGDIENVVKKRTMEVSNFLKMLRSASRNDKEELKAHGESHNDWKIKQDNDQLRVLYREGPQGTPYHTLLAEGCVDGPIDVCLCVSWEVGLYKKWAIANMDIKVDFLPPSLINFISRQLIGNGHKLYQKALASIAIDDDDYNHALEEPMYVRIRKEQKSDKNLEIIDEVKSTGHHIEEPPDKASQVTVPMADRSRVSEIEEVTGNVVSSKGNQKDTPNNIVVEHHARKGKAFISPEVEHALDVLDEAISIIRERGYAFQSTEHELPNLASVTEVTVCHNSRSAEGNIKLKKTDLDQMLPVLPDQNTAITNNTRENPNSTHMLVPENMSNNLAEIGVKANGIHMNGNYGRSRKSKQKLKKQQLQKRFCCFSPI
ncbi:hypothetical protein QJS04_geneDACA012938 [Acorus gramineus]|uniref:Uncharacterized protein n=1 Tax=Acorus gramineus TaxID=55184 RepID=A0AAV9B2W0_ACOGR|nr:hypothetical protein QJS04_geneDACA012938 [Acorus gramineus]